MPKLCQIIALVTGKKTQTEKLYGDLNKKLQKAELFNGMTGTYRPIDENGEKLPPESKPIVASVDDIIDEARQLLAEIYDLVATQELGNCTAKANIKVDGITILTDVPVTVMLYLEKQLNDLATFVGNIPVLNASEAWMKDASSGSYVTAPLETHRTKKVNKPLVLYPATPEHPAQTQVITEDVLAGYWSRTQMSTAMPLPEKKQILARITRLSDAVKSAREEANSIEVVEMPIGASVLNYVFGK